MGNVIITFETFHWLKEGHSRGETFMVVKLDVSKVYDRVEWSFLKWILDRLNCPSHLYYIIMNYVMSISFQVLINGFPTRNFNTRRGLRQGDP